MGRHKLKIGPKGTYTAGDFDLYERCRPERERCAPDACDGGAVCWVRQGPPAMGTGQACPCLGCGGQAKLSPIDDLRRGRRRAY